MNTLSLRERIAQLFMVAAYSNRDDAHVKEISNLISKDKIGGLCFFQGGPVRQAHLTNLYQSQSTVPLLISMDAEWGLGMRLDSTISYPRQMVLGAMDDNSLIYHMGADIARQLKRLGVHVNFAPVIDINNNPLNPVINTRAFGEDKEMVTQKGLAYMLGLQDNGIIACAKHFPGHGDTDTDSHYALPQLNHSPQRIDTLELYPFKKLIEGGVASVMVAHLEIPQLEPQPKLASSLSENVVQRMLTEELGFKGLIFTDALNMKGVSDYYKPVELNYLALKAGNDVILFPSEVHASISKIEREVKRGKFPEEEINRRCRKILEAKYWVGLNKYKPINTKNLHKDLNRPSSELIIRQILEQSITVLNNEENLIPLQRLDTLNIAYLEIGDSRGAAFREQMELYGPITCFTLKGDENQEQLKNTLYSIKKHNLIIIGFHSLNNSPKRDFGVTSQLSEMVEAIASNKKCILALFGTPYSLSKLNNAKGISGLIVSYENSTLSQELTAQLIFGGIQVNGRLPVAACQNFPMGSGQEAGLPIRLSFSIPESLGIRSNLLAKIDSIALDAISKEASPGMQILAARNGVVFYNKCFGNHTYIDLDLPVTNASIYDVASLTKISSSLLMVMDLYSKGKITLEEKLGSYLSLPDTSKYSNLTVNDILLHQAGLTPWIPFYIRTMQTLYSKQELRNGKLSATFPYQLSSNRFLNKNAYPSRKYFRFNYSFQYPNEVARGLYSVEGIKDSVINWIIQTPLEKPGVYKYSDLGFILLHRAVGNITNIPQQEYLADTFLLGLGMNRTLFNPLNHFEQERIVPTENDVFFRKQLLWGHVHDPAAALMGGITGHAGLFSNANDLAKLLQMYLNKGTYGGTRFLPEATIDLFTSCANCQNGIRRGLGFDKPEPNPEKSTHISRKASSLSYGHSGFTGVLAWVDPAYNLIYIFISNRIHPDTDNRKLIELDVRTKIHGILYDAVIESTNPPE